MEEDNNNTCEVDDVSRMAAIPNHKRISIKSSINDWRNEI